VLYIQVVAHLYSSKTILPVKLSIRRNEHHTTEKYSVNHSFLSEFADSVECFLSLKSVLKKLKRSLKYWTQIDSTFFLFSLAIKKMFKLTSYKYLLNS